LLFNQSLSLWLPFVEQTLPFGQQFANFRRYKSVLEETLLDPAWGNDRHWNELKLLLIVLQAALLDYDCS
jgi:hypothetical protein